MNASTTFLRWLPQAVLISAMCFLVYITVQQDMRQTANDPQIQIAEDAAVAATKGYDATDIAIEYGGTLSESPDAIDIGQSLKPFVIVFDESGNIISASAALAGEVPVPPVGVFSFTAQNKRNSFTWQPIPQARIAAVMVKVQPPAEVSTSTDREIGFILAGRSLREVENRIDQLVNQVALVWVLLLVLSLGYSIWMSGRTVSANSNSSRRT